MMIVIYVYIVAGSSRPPGNKLRIGLMILEESTSPEPPDQEGKCCGKLVGQLPDVCGCDMDSAGKVLPQGLTGSGIGAPAIVGGGGCINPPVLPAPERKRLPAPAGLEPQGAPCVAVIMLLICKRHK